MTNKELKPCDMRSNAKLAYELLTPNMECEIHSAEGTEAYEMQKMWDIIGEFINTRPAESVDMSQARKAWCNISSAVDSTDLDDDFSTLYDVIFKRANLSAPKPPKMGGLKHDVTCNITFTKDGGISLEGDDEAVQKAYEIWNPYKPQKYNCADLKDNTEALHCLTTIEMYFAQANDGSFYDEFKIVRKALKGE